MITRAEVMNRAVHGWGMGCVPYSQSTLHEPDRYRADCSGYVSMCWGITTGWGGESTVTLATGGHMAEISPDDLRPGDAVAMAGPGTGGDNGHIILFESWLNQDPDDSRFYGYEQAGGTVGPRRRLFNWPSGYRAYRYRDIADSAVPSTSTTTPRGSETEMILIKGSSPTVLFLACGRVTTPTWPDCEALMAAGVKLVGVSDQLFAQYSAS